MRARKGGLRICRHGPGNVFFCRFSYFFMEKLGVRWTGRRQGWGCSLLDFPFFVCCVDGVGVDRDDRMERMNECYGIEAFFNGMSCHGNWRFRSGSHLKCLNLQCSLPLQQKNAQF